ncbi:hypothetical protein HK097_001452 [Rhizophlyctis rosea]|uniref:T6SS Phospholipase effector Tle1-like catalytic domain-containing protein n=1 Tax=Rhizophlyctis rosea TaxID=64517 RepID=A0AAD5SGW8_9FUNG|nr:hypothetical protein HK097_001452 [Rhizophlyctis rosea]
MTVEQVWKRFTNNHLPLGHPKRTVSLVEVQDLVAKGIGLDLEDWWLNQFSRPITVQFVGLFDVVGTRGLPFGSLEGYSQSTLRYSERQNWAHIECLRHALALDERRLFFRPELFLSPDEDTDYMGENKKVVDAKLQDIGVIEQRWFIGVHSSIGGGLLNDELSQIPLKWMMKEAKNRGGLKFRGSDTTIPEDSRADFKVKLYGGEYRDSVIDDSWPLFRHLRPLGTERSLNETVDATVVRRWQHMPEYRPKNLEDWARRMGLDLDSLEPVTLVVATGQSLNE